MNQKIKWFTLGLMTGLVFIGTRSWLQNQPANAVRGFPQEIRDFMLEYKPWLETARGAQVGPFTIAVPNKSSEPPEAIIWPQNSGFPHIFLSEKDISLIDSKYKMFSVKFDNKSGEFMSHDMSPDLTSGTSFFDNNFDGQYDVKMHIDAKNKRAEIYIYFESKWLPVLLKEKKKFLEVSGVLREIRLENFIWEFVD
jgi:hypothetical protein